MDPRSWIQSLTIAAQRNDGEGVASLLALVDKQASEPRRYPNLSSIKGQTHYFMGGGVWGELLSEYVATIELMQRNTWVEAYEHLANAYQKLLTIFSESEEQSWLMPLVHQSSFDLRLVAGFADEGDKTGAMKNLRHCSEKLSKGFSVCWNDRTDIRSPECKKRGVVYIVNNALKVYFKLGTLRLCKNMTRPLEMGTPTRPALITMDFVPRSDLVTYKFYVGRLHVLEDKYAEALECLEYALAQCHPRARANRRKILTYLIPIKLCKGSLPSARLIQEYNFVEFRDLVTAIRVGDLHTFNVCLEKFQELFIKQGTYLVLERARFLVYRNLIKNIDKYNEAKTPNRVDLNTVQRILEWCDEGMSLDELECITANLIFKGYIRGYISHAKRTLVLAQDRPFPFTAVTRGEF